MVSVRKHANPKAIRANKKYNRKALEYAWAEYPITVFSWVSNMAPRIGGATAPPRKGNRLASPTDVPAISTGNSSLADVKATTTMALLNMPRRKQRR